MMSEEETSTATPKMPSSVISDAHETTHFVAAMRPGTGKLLAEKRIKDEEGNHDRHDPAGGAAHAFEDSGVSGDAED